MLVRSDAIVAYPAEIRDQACESCKLWQQLTAVGLLQNSARSLFNGFVRLVQLLMGMADFACR